LPTDRKEMPVSLSNRLAAEFLGTFWPVLGGCGSAVLAAAFPQLGFAGVALAFGLTVLTMAYGMDGRAVARP
jgi:aquaporin Z